MFSFLVIGNRGWIIDNTTNLCSPKPPGNFLFVCLFVNKTLVFIIDSKVVQQKPSHEKLAKLTDLVSFLEN